MSLMLMMTMRHEDSHISDNDPDDEHENLQKCFKRCCKNKGRFGLEDLFWLLFLVMIIALSVVKATTDLPLTKVAWIGGGCIVLLVVLYLTATLINKFCFDDASTAHWNAHARFTAAAQAQRLQQLGQQDARVHVCAPPRMGGAKLNIIYTVGDVPILAPRSSLQGITPSSSTSTNATQKFGSFGDTSLPQPYDIIETQTHFDDISDHHNHHQDRY